MGYDSHVLDSKIALTVYRSFLWEYHLFIIWFVFVQYTYPCTVVRGVSQWFMTHLSFVLPPDNVCECMSVDEEELSYSMCFDIHSVFKSIAAILKFINCYTFSIHEECVQFLRNSGGELRRCNVLRQHDVFCFCFIFPFLYYKTNWFSLGVLYLFVVDIVICFL